MERERETERGDTKKAKIEGVQTCSRIGEENMRERERKKGGG